MAKAKDKVKSKSPVEKAVQTTLGPTGNALLAGKEAFAGARAAGRAAGVVAGRSKVPLVAGAGLAGGVAGGLAVVRRRHSR